MLYLSLQQLKQIRNMKQIENIQVGKTYLYYDDGKIRESRKHNVFITNIVPFSEVDEETKRFWSEEIESCYWLYAKETDYFLEGNLQLSTGGIEKVIFVRTLDGGWFSLGWWAGRLTVD